MERVFDIGDQASVRRWTGAFELLISICRLVVLGLTGAGLILWFCSLLAHPLESRWLTLSQDMPNAMLLNVLGFDGLMHQQYQQLGEAMPWLGGVYYTLPAVCVGVLIPLSAIITGRRRFERTPIDCIHTGLLALPLTLLTLAMLCSVINIISPVAWQSFVQNREPLVYHGIIVHKTSMLYPLLSFCALLGLTFLLLIRTQPGRRIITSHKSFLILLGWLMFHAWVLQQIGRLLTGPQPPVANRDGGYDSASFLLIASMVWLATFISTRLLNQSIKQPTVKRHWLVNWCMLGLCMFIGAWLVHLGIAFSDLPDSRWCQIVFHHAAALGWWIKFIAAICLMAVSIAWYFWLESRYLQPSKDGCAI